MKTLSLNIKKIALSLMVVGLAIGTQSFINAESKSRTISPFVYQLIDGQYVPVDPSMANDCNTPSEFICKLETPTEHVGGFSKNNIPGDATPWEGSSTGEYITPPGK